MNYDQEILFRLKLAKVDEEWARANQRAMFLDNLKGWIVPAACFAMLLIVVVRLAQ